MDGGEALIRAIRAARDDDTPRLIYADWLEEHGDPARAEFVRLQCWLSARPESHPDWEANWYREQELIRDHGRRWSAPLGGYASKFEHDAPEFDRGFVSSFYASDIPEFTWVLPELVRATATDRLEIGFTFDQHSHALGGCEAMEHIRELETNADGRGLSEDGIAQLIRSTYLQNLRRLDLAGAYLGPGNPDAALFAREPVLPELEHLHLGLSFRTDVGRIIDLIRSPHRQRLVGLEIKYLNETEVAALCEVPELARITHLDIGWTTATDEGGRRLAACPYLDRIKLLNYAGDGSLNDAGIDQQLTESVRGLLLERFGDRVVLDAESHCGGPAGRAYRRRVVTGRRL